MKKIHLVIAVAGAMMMSAMPVETYAQLLAGTSGTGEGKVYAYQGGTNWTAISPSLGDAVLDIVQFDGTLYAATMSTDLGGEVWRYDGGTSWTVVGTGMDEEVCALAIYNGQLYAGTSENGGKLYRYNGTNFVNVGTVTNFYGIRAMYSSSYGYLQLGDINYDLFGHYDGTKLYFDADLSRSCVVDFAEYNNKLYAATEENADLIGSTNGINWSDVLDYNNTYALWKLQPFQGQLYLGYDNGQLAYMDSSETWNSVLTVSDSIISMVASGNTMLYFGTGVGAVGDVEDGTSPGYVYAYTGNGETNATLISGPMGDGVQCLYYPADPLLITPTTGFSDCGPVGGPFTVTNETFSLTNRGTNSLDWCLTINWSPTNISGWLAASPTNGTLDVGASTNVTVSLNSNAYSLPLGVYAGTVWFINLSDNFVQMRQFTLTVSGPPIITCPGNIIATATNLCETVVNYAVTVSGGCPPITTNCAPPSGSVFTNGTATVNCSVTDACGRPNSCSFTVTVLPPPPPVITCPSNITVTGGSSGAVVNYVVTVSGGCPPITTNCVPPSGSVFPIGTTIVNCSVIDSCCQSNSCSFTVTVNLLSSLSISNAIQSGLTWLISQQNTNGSWDSSYPVAYTGFAVLKLEERAFELGYNSPFDNTYPYKTNVIKGLNYIFSQAGVYPDTRICFDQGGYYETRDTGIAMMAIAASKAPANIVNVSNSIVNGMTYQAVLQANVDYFAWSQQSDGGWLTSSGEDGVPPDNSNTGYAVLGLYYAESPVYGFACVIPPQLTAELSTNWINAIQVNGGADDGGSCSWHYLGAETNLLYTGNLLFEMSFVGDDTSVPRVQRAIAYIERNWDDNNEDPGWRPHNYLAMDCLMEGFGTLGITNITVNGISVDWFADFASAIVANQQSDGSWPADSYSGDAMLSTELALLVLEKVSPLVDPLRITPATGFTATGPVGGPFTPTNENFTLTNTGTTSLSWTLVNTSVWFNASPGGGTLAAGGTANVTVSLNTNARSLAAGVYSASVWFTDLNDNVGQSRQLTLAVGPALAIQKATPALRIFAGDNTDINRREELATADQDKSWVGAASASHPTRYSFTLLSYPTNISQTHIFLIPLNFLGDWQGPYGDNHVDYDYASNLVRLVLNPGPNPGSVVASVQWKTNLANAKPNQTALIFTNVGAVGTWTLEFDSDNSGKVTGPDGTNHAFTIADPNVTTDFGDPMVAYFGLQPNGTAGIGQYEDWASILITNVIGGSVYEDFTKYTSRNLSGVWTLMETLPSIVVVSTNDFPAYWITWTPPADGFDIGSKTNVLQTGPWISPQYYSGYCDNSPPYGAAQQFGQKMWVLLPEDDLPTADGLPYGPLSPTAVFLVSTNVSFP